MIFEGGYSLIENQFNIPFYAGWESGFFSILLKKTGFGHHSADYSLNSPLFYVKIGQNLPQAGHFFVSNRKSQTPK
jgi:hypothetical protein